MAASDARFVPIKNQAYRVTFVILDANNDPVGLPVFDSGLPSGVGKALVGGDGGSWVNSTNPVGYAATGHFVHLDLTAAEMNFDTVTILAKTTTASEQHRAIILYTEPRGLRDLAFPVVSGRGIAVDVSNQVSVGALAANVITAAAIASNAFTSAKFAAGAFTSAIWGANAITAAAIAADAIDGDALAATALTEIADAVWDEPMAEPGSVPAPSAQARVVIGFLHALARNKRTQTATTEVLRNDADSVTIGTSTKSDDGTTFTRGEWT